MRSAILRVNAGALICAILVVVACTPDPTPSHTADLDPPQRIVSMSPSVTEVLFALGLEDETVGVTRYCDYPPQAKSKSNIGGYLDPNFEAIVALEPDLVILIQDQNEARRRIESFGIPTLQVEHQNLEGVFESIRMIAEICGVEEKGSELVEHMNGRLQALRETYSGSARPRVLVVVGRAPGSGEVNSVWVAGPGSYFDDVVEAAGGVNACTTMTVAYPEVSREGLSYLDPDVIVDVVPEVVRRGLDPESVLGEWKSLSELRAVREGRVELLTQDFMEIPGPRVVDAIAAVAEAIHRPVGEHSP